MKVKAQTYAIIYTWPADTELSGTVEVRYRRPVSDTTLAKQVRELHRMARQGGWKSPYSIERGNR